MNKNCVIQLYVLSVLNIEQINMAETVTDEINISFRCISPVNETDTFATINCISRDLI